MNKPKNYLAMFGKKTPMFQEGGAMPSGAPQGGGSPQGGELESAIMQVVQTQDPQLALQVVMKIAESMGLTGQAQQGGAPAPEAAPAPEQAPMGRYGMKLPIFKKTGVFK